MRLSRPQRRIFSHRHKFVVFFRPIKALKISRSRYYLMVHRTKMSGGSSNLNLQWHSVYPGWKSLVLVGVSCDLVVPIRIF